MEFQDILLLSLLEEAGKPRNNAISPSDVKNLFRSPIVDKEKTPSLYPARYAYPVIKKSFAPIADITVDEEHAIVLMDLKDGLATAAGVLELGYREQEVMKGWHGARDSILDLSKSLAKHFTPPVALVITSVTHPGELLFMARDGEILLDIIG